MYNLEAWYNVTNPEIELLESVDTRFLRNLLKAPISTPKEIVYFELGCVPLREVIMKRRILFLHYILNQNENSMLYKFFETQRKTKKPKDWICTVQQNLKDLGLEETFQEIRNMKKLTLKRMLNIAITKKACERLLEMKEKHSKLKNLKYSNLKMQNYQKTSRVKSRSLNDG